jgi:putative ABC transport system substrate-binding protein
MVTATRGWHGLARQQTRTVPVIFVVVADPVGSGFVGSLARPGGNATGFTVMEPTMGGKWLELLKEIEPRVTRVAIVFNPNTAPLCRVIFPVGGQTRTAESPQVSSIESKCQI